MTPKLRKLVGTVLLLVLIVVYMMVVAALAPAILKPDSPWIQLAFYAIAGVGWAFPAGVLIKWMAKTDNNGA
jgi:hypothetical protein